MDELMVFQNPEFGEIRTAEVNGEPWFCLADICRPLGLQAKECRRRLKSDGVVLTHLADSMGRPQEMLCVNEANLYRAIFQSHKPEAERFTDWVTEEVLPAIRRTGRYETHPMTMAEQLAAQANLLVAMEQRQDRLEARVDTALTALARPKADSWTADLNEAIRRYCEATGLTDAVGRGRLYAALEREANCLINSRLARLRARKKRMGMTRRDYMALTKLDAIAVDKGLRTAFEGIVARETARTAASGLPPEAGDKEAE